MTGSERIARERQRQIEAEGWTPEHDDRHDHFEMTVAAICYGAHVSNLPIKGKVTTFEPPNCGCREAGCPHTSFFGETSWKFPWPWDPKWWKPSEDPIRNLVKAGALIAAEIDRLQRANMKEGE